MPESQPADIIRPVGIRRYFQGCPQIIRLTPRLIAQADFQRRGVAGLFACSTQTGGSSEVVMNNVAGTIGVEGAVDYDPVKYYEAGYFTVIPGPDTYCHSTTLVDNWMEEALP